VPKARGTGGHIIISSQRVKEFVIAIDEDQVRLVFLITVRLLYAPHCLASLRCRLEHRIEQIANDLVTGRRNPTFAPAFTSAQIMRAPMCVFPVPGGP